MLRNQRKGVFFGLVLVIHDAFVRRIFIFCVENFRCINYFSFFSFLCRLVLTNAIFCAILALNINIRNK